jgi:CheY-like chemotaxis protein
MARPTLLIVDDHEDFRSSARMLLELEGFEVVGVAEDGPSALAAVEALRRFAPTSYCSTSSFPAWTASRWYGSSRLGRSAHESC